MAALLGGVLTVVIYANWQKFHRERIEKVTVTRFAPLPSPSPIARP